jgi:hypothetical protein
MIVTVWIEEETFYPCKRFGTESPPEASGLGNAQSLSILNKKYDIYHPHNKM